MLKKRKIKRRVKRDKSNLPAKIDLVDLNNLFIKFCARILEGGDIEKVGRIIDFIKTIKFLQEEKMTYEKAFIVKQLDRHGLTADDYLLAREI